MKKGIIFDLDGTLCDSTSFWNHLGEAYLKTIGIIDKDIDDECHNMSIMESSEYIKKKHNLEATANFIRMEINCLIEEAYFKKLELKPGVLDFLEYMYAHGYKMIIATDTPKPLVLGLFKRYGIPHYFIDVITTIKVKKSKEYPDVYDYCLLRMDLLKRDVVVFEDNQNVIKMLKDNAYDTIRVVDDPSEVDTSYALYTIDNFSDTRAYEIMDKLI